MFQVKSESCEENWHFRIKYLVVQQSTRMNFSEQLLKTFFYNYINFQQNKIQLSTLLNLSKLIVSRIHIYLSINKESQVCHKARIMRYPVRIKYINIGLSISQIKWEDTSIQFYPHTHTHTHTHTYIYIYDDWHILKDDYCLYYQKYDSEIRTNDYFIQRKVYKMHKEVRCPHLIGL